MKIFSRSILVFALMASSFAQKPAAKATTQHANSSRAQAAKQTPQQTEKPWQKIPIPALPPFHPQEPKRIQLANGMVIFLQEDHELPLIDGIIRIRGGSRLEPANKVGLTDIYGEAWRTGGTTSKTGDQLDDFLEARAAKVETGSGEDSTYLNWSCLKGDFNDVFKIVQDVLHNPAFREDKIALAKRQIDTAISRRNDEPNEIAAREAAKLAYGAESPFARQDEYYTIAAATRDDLVQWHDRYVHPNNIILGVSGDFDPATMETAIRQAFERWQPGPAAPREIETPITPAKPGYYFIQKSDINQSNVRMVGLGIERNNPDYYAVSVMNEVLGGGFSGRLMTNLRSKAGLAYDVHGGVGAAFDHPGMFQLVMETKSSTTAAAIDGLTQQLDDLQKNPATPQELKRAKDTILNSFIFDFDDKEKVLAERMTYEFYGYPADFLERFRAGIEKVTSEDVARVARKYVPHQDQLAVLVLGNAPDFDRKLSTFGKVTDIDISIPEQAPGAAKQSSTPSASNAAGKALISKVVSALGGANNLERVKSFKQVMQSVRSTPQGDIPLQVEQTIVYPDRAYIHMTAAGQNIDTILTPAAAVITTPQGSRPLPDAFRDANLENLKRDIIYVAQNADTEGFFFSADGSTKTIHDVKTEQLDVNAAGVPLRWYVDPSDGHILQAEFNTINVNGTAVRTVDYSDWRAAGALTLPFQRIVTENNEVVSRDTISTFEPNPTIDPKLFNPPGSTNSPQ